MTGDFQTDQGRARLPLRVVAAVLLLVLGGAHVVRAADFERGQRAFDAGDYQAALLEWEELAEAGHAQAQYRLGGMHEYGRGVARSDARAAHWFVKAAAQGVVEAQYRVGVFYENGWGVPRDASVAAWFYETAAEQGHPFAQHDLAFMLFEGQGMPEDRVEAYKWLTIAAMRRGSVMIKHLHHLSQSLSAAERAEAEERVRLWLEARN